LDIKSYLNLGCVNKEFRNRFYSGYFLTIYLNNLAVFRIAEDLKKN
jgi:hypothetical protein